MVHVIPPFTLEQMDASIIGFNLYLRLLQTKRMKRGLFVYREAPLYLYHNCVGLRDVCGCGPLSDYARLRIYGTE